MSHPRRGLACSPRNPLSFLYSRHQRASLLSLDDSSSLACWEMWLSSHKPRFQQSGEQQAAWCHCCLLGGSSCRDVLGTKTGRKVPGERAATNASKVSQSLELWWEAHPTEDEKICVLPLSPYQGGGDYGSQGHNSIATHFTNVQRQQRVAKYARRKCQWRDKNKPELASSPREIVLLCLLTWKYLDDWKAITGLGIINYLD